MKANQKEKPVVSAKIEFVASTPWGWASSESPALAVHKAQSVLSYSGKTPKKGSDEWEKQQEKICLWMVRADEWDRLVGYAPANKDGVVGILLNGHAHPEWQVEVYDLMREVVHKWASED